MVTCYGNIEKLFYDLFQINYYAIQGPMNFPLPRTLKNLTEMSDEFICY